MKETQTKLN